MTLADAIDAVQGERATAARRLAMIDVVKAERDKARARVAELEAAIRSVIDTTPTIAAPVEIIDAVNDYHELVVMQLREAMPLPTSPAAGEPT